MPNTVNREGCAENENPGHEDQEISKEESAPGELDLIAKQMKNHMWVDSILLNYTEELDITISDPASPGQDKRVVRRISLGITAKSDNRAPAKVLHYAASKSLHTIFELEKERWLDETVMKMEAEQLKRTLESKAAELNNGAIPEPTVKPAS